ncbi:MAG: DUF1211 domain-containing protein [Lewinellaceae bacterium]|nr:DUF1211 domain-containing protein [Lewinellaceae bacterium]
MGKGRLEAFSDGVLAIIITIMVLEMKVPHGHDLASLAPLLPVFLSYLLSFIYLAIYWNNHHHLMQAVKKVNGATLWANMHLLFWLSLVPFASGWMGENDFATIPVAIYGSVLVMAAIAYFILTQALIGLHGKDSTLAEALGADRKGKISVAIYLVGISLTFLHPYWGCALYLVVACIWLVPDQRFEKRLNAAKKEV